MKICALIFFLFISVNLFGQWTNIYTDKDVDFKNGIELLNKEKYGAAQKSFNLVVNKYKNSVSEIATDAEYYSALCSFELFNNDAEILLKNFISNHNESPKIKMANYYLALYYYRKKRFKEAIPHFEIVNVYDLKNELLPEYYFKSGYSYFERKEYDKAKTKFYEIKDVDTKYSSAANYFYSHIAYLQKNYQTALLGFQKLTLNPNFSAVVPYYISQIYYLQGRYDELLVYALPIMDSASAEKAGEIAHMIGDAYYRINKYKESIKYLELSKTKSSRFNQEDAYQLGYANYKIEDYKQAEQYLKIAANNNDSLAQNASYLLGDTYVKTNQKKAARMSFEKAYKMKYDEDIKEDALFNFAKLSYELDLNPFDESIKSFELYLNTYPNSVKRDEAYKYLVNVYLTTKNYTSALNSIDNIKEKSVELKYAYQKIAYYRAIEFYNNNDLDQAMAHFDKSMIYPLEKSIAALCSYWKGECYYKLNLYDEAIKNYNKFIYEPSAILQKEFNDAHYNLGYAYYQKFQYADAVMWFRKFVFYKVEPSPKKLNDAYIRIGDCYFINKELKNAVEYYDKAIEVGALTNDYAMFQKSIAEGVLGNYENKISTLEQLLAKYPKTKYAPEANFELANTYLTTGKQEKALQGFNVVIENYNNSSYLKKALLKKALILFNSNNDALALGIFKKIVADYPATTESQEALTGIKNIYLEDPNAVPDYPDWIRTIPFANVSTSELDSTTFEVAEKRYMKGDCDNSMLDFGNYISKYPAGIFLLDASYYKADCEIKLNKLADALTDLDKIIEKPKNKFSENALVKAARISNKQGNQELAIKYYTKLEQTADFLNNINEAKIALMNCYNKQKQYAKAQQYAYSVLQIEKVNPDVFETATFIDGNSSLQLGDTANALTKFIAFSNGSKTELATEAKFNVAQIKFNKGLLEESRTIAYEIINQNPSYDYWIAKSFILIGDIFAAKKDYYSAKNTYNSIIENADDTGIISDAQQKLNKVLEIEKELELRKIAKPKAEEINLFDSGNNSDLFNEEAPTEELPKAPEGGNNE